MRDLVLRESSYILSEGNVVGERRPRRRREKKKIETQEREILTGRK